MAKKEKKKKKEEKNVFIRLSYNRRKRQ